MTRRDIIIFLFKWKLTILVIPPLVLGAVAGLAYLLPQSYQARASVLVERNRAPVMRSNFAPVLDLVEVLTSESELVRSRTVMSGVVDQLQPHLRPKKDSSLKRTVAQVQHSLAELGLIDEVPPRERWVAMLQKQVEPKALTNSSVINITYSDEDPQWAAKIVNAVTKGYIQHHLKVYAQGGSSEVFRQQVESSERTVSQLRRQMAEYKRASSTSAVAERQKSLVQALASTTSERASAQNELADLLTRFTPDYPKAQLLRGKIARLSGSMDQMAQHVERLEETQARVDELRTAIEAEGATLKEYRQRYDQAKVDETADVRLINVRVVDYADVPGQPRLSRLLLILLSLPTGLLLALGIAMLREYFDRRVLSPGAAERILGLPELGSVPLLRRRGRG